MAPITSKIEQIGAALTTAHATYGKSNPKSSQTHKESIVTLPGGKSCTIATNLPIDTFKARLEM